MSSRMKKPAISPEERAARLLKARRRFRALVRLVMANLFWLGDIDDTLGDNVMLNIQKLTRKKIKKSTLTTTEKLILTKPKQERTEEEKHLLNRAIGGLKCFRRYPPNVKTQLAAVTYFVYIGPGRVIVKQDHAPSAMYFLLSGEATVTVRTFDKMLKEWIDTNHGTFGNGTMFGEVALIHGISRTATITTTMPCELLMIKKDDFDIVLKETVWKAWEQIQIIMNRFSYFKNLDAVSKRECSIISRTKAYTPDETILGDDIGLPNYTYLITKGSCCLIEHLMMYCVTVNGIKHYKLYNPDVASKSRICDEEKRICRIIKKDLHTTFGKISQSKGKKKKGSKKASISKTEVKPIVGKASTSKTEIKPGKASASKIELKPSSGKTSASKTELKPIFASNSRRESRDSHKLSFSRNADFLTENIVKVETHFLKVCDFSEGAIFNIGEDFKRRRVVALTHVNCLLIPSYWLMKMNKDNIWSRVQQFLNKNIPSTEQIFKDFMEEEKFNKYKKGLVRDLLAEKRVANDNSIHNVPYSIRLKEGASYDL